MNSLIASDRVATITVDGASFMPANMALMSADDVHNDDITVCAGARCRSRRGANRSSTSASPATRSAPSRSTAGLPPHVQHASGTSLLTRRSRAPLACQGGKQRPERDANVALMVKNHDVLASAIDARITPASRSRARGRASALTVRALEYAEPR